MDLNGKEYVRMWSTAGFGILMSQPLTYEEAIAANNGASTDLYRLIPLDELASLDHDGLISDPAGEVEAETESTQSVAVGTATAFDELLDNMRDILALLSTRRAE